ncbi:MAG: hypothetical protein EZS28_020153 [Streblomastix strix]|uniref:SPRY domain-containing protein n=1 Tax=Streblomastix strix TaxID=222440 RepID=A0A5J4VP59_9EUKA|nr:MAG: hypothetical protein EZS28_020153 [Streblomastix strix]
MTKKLSEELHHSDTINQPNKNVKNDEIPLLINDLLSENYEQQQQQQQQTTERLVTMVLRDQDCELSISQLYISPLVVMLKSKDEEHSQTACEALSKLIRKSPNIQKSLLKSGFIQMTSFALMEEGDLHHIQTNILVIILDLITSGADIHAMGVLLPVLEKLAKEKDSKQQEIAMKAQIIQTILTSKGVSVPSPSSEIQELKKKNEESLKQIEEQKRLNEEYKKQIIDLEHQIEEAKPKSCDVAISINVPTGSYTKKDGEYTYTSTSGEYKTFPINPIITQGIYKCEFKANQLGNIYFGVMKTGLIVPFGKNSSTQPYTKDNIMTYRNGNVYWNGKGTAGNKNIQTGDIVAIEVNMNVVPRTAHFFTNNVQQPVYISGLPESVQFYFSFNSSVDSISVLSLKYLASSTVTNIPGSKEAKWE